MRVSVVILVLTIGACANPLNRVTSDRYTEECAAAEKAGNYGLAEEACYRALVNVDIGNLGPELKSERLYNLGRIKKRILKLSEAESLLRESLSVEESLSGPAGPKIGRRLAELAATLGAQNKWGEGVPVMERLAPMSSEFTGGERSFLAALYGEYAKQATSLKRTKASASFTAKAKELSK